MTRHPSKYAFFTMQDEAARTELLADRATAGLLVTIGGQHQIGTVHELATFIPKGSVLVVNHSGTFFARYPNCEMPDGSRGTVHFAHMCDDSAREWVVTVPVSLRSGDAIGLPGRNSLRLTKPYLVRGLHATWEASPMWVASFKGRNPFDLYQAQYGQPIRYPYDRTKWTMPAMQNCFSGHRTSAMMNNGGRNITRAVLDRLLTKGIHIATLEMRTGVGVDDQSGLPLPEFVQLDRENAAIINAAIAEGRQIIPVGTGVIRALDWFYHRTTGRVHAGQGWCTNVITPATGTWMDAWVSGMHEPCSTHLAMGSAIMGEPTMLDAMITARDRGLRFHENGDTHLYLPSSCA